MAKGYLDDLSLTWDCSKCGQKITEKIARLKGNPEVRCPACHSVIRVDAKKFREATKPLDDLKKLFD
jgi:DNA-directed RNA polymerase subunit RPC12/RpoP